MNLLDLFVKIGVKDEASGEVSKIGETFSKLGSVASGIAVGVGTALAGAATGVAALTKQSVEAYSEFEQLKGGIETLFGSGGQSLEEYAASIGQSVESAKSQYDALMNAQSTVMANAEKAWQSAGMSANDYMNTAITMSASLINSLGGDTEAAAAAVDMAIVDMSDNVNKMGYFQKEQPMLNRLNCWKTLRAA